jgi:hypothetical protein
VLPTKAHGCVGNFKRAWMTAYEKAGFPVGRKHGGYVFHNTRHTAVTNFANSGTPEHQAMAVSGHRTRSVFARYSIRFEEQTWAAMRQTTAYTQGLRTARKVDRNASRRVAFRPRLRIRTTARGGPRAGGRELPLDAPEALVAISPSTRTRHLPRRVRRLAHTGTASPSCGRR